MTEEEVEVVAEELAKIGGTAWCSGRGRGPHLRVVTSRYREVREERPSLGYIS
jgi:hypothetical protein